MVTKIDGVKRRATRHLGAVTCTLTCEPISNFGAPVDFLAVGSDVFSTYLQDPGGIWTYRVMSGTSFSAAVISGVIHANGGIPKNGIRVDCGSPMASYYVGVRR